MGGYGNSYIPYRINYKNCNQYRKKCPVLSVGYLYGVKHDSRSTLRMRYSDLTKRLTYGRVGLKLDRVKNKLNAFKRYSGAPGGAGTAPFNTF